VVVVEGPVAALNNALYTFKRLSSMRAGYYIGLTVTVADYQVTDAECSPDADAVAAKHFILQVPGRRIEAEASFTLAFEEGKVCGNVLPLGSPPQISNTMDWYS
jgi:hypothetical protein